MFKMLRPAVFTEGHKIEPTNPEHIHQVSERPVVMLRGNLYWRTACRGGAAAACRNLLLGAESFLL